MTSSNQRQQIAQFPPFLPRTLTQVAGQEGADCARLCHGIGLLPEDLNEPSLRLSYRQVSRLVRRAEAELSAGVGLRVGDSNVLGSLGLVGYTMSLCPTLGAAITLAPWLRSDSPGRPEPGESPESVAHTCVPSIEPVCPLLELIRGLSASRRILPAAPEVTG